MRRFLLIFVFMVLTITVNAKERVLWQQGVEIAAELVVGVERKIMLPEKVRVGLKKKYQRMFKVSVIDNLVFITAKVKFNEKIVVQGLESGRFYVVEASVSEDSQKARDELIVHLAPPEKNPSGERLGKLAKPFGGAISVEPIDLVQFISQSLYAPNRTLIEPTPGIKRVIVKKRLVAGLYRGGALKAEVLGGWFGGGLYATAIRLQNETPLEVEFEPCRVRGDFYSSTVQFRKVFAKGNRNDFTVAYLLSKKPFDSAVLGGELKCV